MQARGNVQIRLQLLLRDRRPMIPSGSATVPCTAILSGTEPGNLDMVMAPEGQTAKHWPQSKHAPESDSRAFPSLMEMPPLMHTERQSPHPVQSCSSMFMWRPMGVNPHGPVKGKRFGSVHDVLFLEFFQDPLPQGGELHGSTVPGTRPVDLDDLLDLRGTLGQHHDPV